jgi:hypothetical protein
MTSEILNNLKTLVVPIVTTAVRDTLVADVGTIVYDSTQNKLCFCKSKTAGATSWELITSVEEGGE